MPSHEYEWVSRGGKEVKQRVFESCINLAKHTTDHVVCSICDATLSCSQSFRSKQAMHSTIHAFHSVQELESISNVRITSANNPEHLIDHGVWISMSKCPTRLTRFEKARLYFVSFGFINTELEKLWCRRLVMLLHAAFPCRYI